MLRYRIIPTLLLHKNGLYKTVQFSTKKGKYVGDPINVIKIFNDKFVDEIIILDIDASKEGRGPDFQMIEKIASECFRPLSYGGGISNLDQIKELFKIGVEKIIINTALLHNASFLKQVSSIYGSQSVVAAVDIKKNIFGKPKVFNSAKKKYVSENPKSYLHFLQNEGVGEIYLSFVDRDGMLNGYDIELINDLTSEIKVPVIVNGGAKSITDFVDVIKNTNVNALSAGSIFTFNGPHKAVLITYICYDDLIKLLKE